MVLKINARKLLYCKKVNNELASLFVHENIKIIWILQLSRYRADKQDPVADPYDNSNTF